MGGARIASVALAAMLVSAPALAQERKPLTWHKAVAELAGERTRAVTCARILKRHAANDGTLSRGDMAYGEAKAAMDEVIGTLVVAVTQGQEPIAVDDLEKRLTAAVEQREAFCARVEPLVPEDSGAKGLFDRLVGGALAPLIEAVVAVYLDYREAAREDDRLVRKTIATQLEATRWPDFPDIEP